MECSWQQQSGVINAPLYAGPVRNKNRNGSLTAHVRLFIITFLSLITRFVSFFSFHPHNHVTWTEKKVVSRDLSKVIF